MNDKPKQLILIGGGSSLKEGISLGLWEKLKDKFTIGTNFSYKYFSSTIQSYVDNTFYNKEIQNLASLPLIIGHQHKNINPLPNTICIPSTNIYTRDLSKGVYSARLVGIFALSLAIYLLDEGEIYLLGYDYGNIDKNIDPKNRSITHFYQGEIEHNGIGKISYYNMKNKDEVDFGVYKQEQRVRIFNVSLHSRLKVFPKISYEDFFKKLDTFSYNQDELRQEIKLKFKQ